VTIFVKTICLYFSWEWQFKKISAWWDADG